MRVLATFCRDYGLTPADVEPWDLFANILDQHPGARDAFRRGATAGERARAFVPDLLAHLGATEAQAVDRLIEVKTIHVNNSRYPPSISASGQAVNRRAREVHPDYARKAASLDARCFGTPSGHSGPFQDKLRGYGNILAVVSGAFGEVSEDVHELVHTVAEMGADWWQARLNAPDRDCARAYLIQHMRGQLGMCTLRGNARLLLHRTQFVRSCNDGRSTRFSPSRGMGTDYYGADMAFRPWFSRHAGNRPWHRQVGGGGDSGASPRARAGGGGGRGGRGGYPRHYHGGAGVPRA